jgi:K+-sensing histidine kinase KdpD
MRKVATWFQAHRGPVAVTVAIFLPLGVSALMVPFRASFANAAASLVLVAVITLVATMGTRPAGYVAALSASFWFDFFLTRPYDQVAITHRADIEISVSLFVVGVVITELAARSRQHQQRAEEESSYVELFHQVAEDVAAGRPTHEVIGQVRAALVGLLRLRDCRFDTATPIRPINEIQRDGRVTFGTVEWPVDTWGLPGQEIALAVMARGEVVGRFVLVPTPGEGISLQRRLVAVALADQVGALALSQRLSA